MMNMHLFSKHVFIVLHPYVTSQNVAILHLGVSLKFKFAFFGLIVYSLLVRKECWFPTRVFVGFRVFYLVCTSIAMCGSESWAVLFHMLCTAGLVQ